MSSQLQMVRIVKPQAASGKLGIMDEIGSLVYWDPKRDGVFAATLEKGRVNSLDFGSALPVRFMECEPAELDAEAQGTREIQG